MVVDDPTTMGDVVFFAFELTFGTGFMTENSTAYLHEIPGSSKASGSSRSINAARCDAAAITLVFRSAEWRIIPTSKCFFFSGGMVSPVINLDQDSGTTIFGGMILLIPMSLDPSATCSRHL